MRPRRIGAVTVKAMTAAVVALAAALPAQPAYAAATNFYVDPVNGSDSNSGTSTASAFRTVQAAQNAVRAINANMADDIVVNLRGGTYTLTGPVTFGTADSGTNGHTVVYQAYNGETPVISGGKSITGWTAAANGEYKASIGTTNFRQLYVNGVRATRARYPDSGTDFNLQGSDTTNKLLRVPSSQVSNWGNLNQVEMMLETQWGESYLRLKSISTAGSTASISIQDHEAGILFQRPWPQLANNSPFHFENAHEFLNEPGEFYVDTTTQTLYYKPRPGEDMSTASVKAPTVQTLFDVKGTSLDSPAHDLRFSGLTFTQTTWMEASNNGYLNAQGGTYNISANTSNQQYVGRPPAAVQAADTDRISVTNNVFSQLGSTALDLSHGVHNSSAIGNYISDIAGNGIMVGKFSDPTVEYHTIYNPPSSPAGEDAREVVKSVTVKNNLITRTGEDYLGTAAINAGFVNSTTIDHNDISDGPWAGISLGWGWQSAANAEGNNSVSYNRIGNVMNRLCDSAAIYHLSNDPGTVINGNYIHDVVRNAAACGSAVAGLYTDEGSDNMTLSNNVLSHTDGFINQNRNGANVTLTNNTTSGDTVIKASGLESGYQWMTLVPNLAWNKTATSSSVYGTGTEPSKAVDNNGATGWSPTGTDTSAWWQVDLGQPYQLGQFVLTTRQDLDQSATRGNFEVRGSNDPNFGSYTVLGRQTDTLPFASTLTGDIDVRRAFRYVRVAKTDGGYFYITDFSVQQTGGAQAASTGAPSTNPSTYYTIKNVNSGQVADVSGGSTTDGGSVIQWPNNGGANQQWNIVPVTGQLYKIVNRNSGKALEIPWNSHWRGTGADQYSYNAGNNQLWYFEPTSGGYLLRNFESKQVLEVTGASTTNGATTDQSNAINQSHQAWTVQ
ncbi:RICIN domain-containing protein [Kitasatospora sp. DSM 101779]|uniref:RICIN domain-containing protein n=1 Tax=Kitasatospora sp. DSM 101779 TaxID=2853165 RepID=UPI0021D91B91|nr:RICIN domain-containing protein [Kitasatospora sp. DSM 101779]MCU7826775.1 RICIN domain-containing protein [Kitasatospora sp. DSM 101779]